VAKDPFAAGPSGAGDDQFDEDIIDSVDAYMDDADMDVDIKEALGLPDSLPPIRLPSLPELAAQAREAPLPSSLAALAGWVGTGGREVTDDGELTSADMLEAVGALGVDPEDFAYLWEYAIAVEWLAFDDDDDRVVQGELAEDWAAGDDETVMSVWSSTLAAVLGETLIVTGPAEDDDAGKLGFDGLDFQGQAMALAILLFLTRREGLSLTDFTEVLWENAAGDLPSGQAAPARATWVAYYGDPARLLLDKLAELHAVTEADDTIWLTPLALAALHEQLVEAGVDIPLLPPTAAELTGAQLLAMAEGVGDEEFEAESDAWVAARGGDEAARELLELAAHGDPGERMLAVATVTRIGVSAEPAWRDSLDVPEVRGYAKVALVTMAGVGEMPGEEPPPGLELLPEDLAWVATDMLALACDDEFPDPDELAAAFHEAVPPGQEEALFDAMWRGAHPDAVDVLNHVGRYHPDKQVAKAARTAAHKAVSRRAAHS
jgi:hypothetical protein